MPSTAGAASLELVRGRARERRWALGPRSYRIGRVGDNEVCLDDRAVSRYHARIEYESGSFFIVDAESSAGVFLGGERVGRAELADGALIRLGDTVLRFNREVPAAVQPGGDVLLEVLEAINSTRALDEVLERALDAVMRLTGAERGFILLAPPEGATADGPAGLELRVMRSPHEQGPLAGAGGISSTILERAIESDAMVALGDALQDESLDASRSVAAYQLRAVVCVPLRTAQEEAGKETSLLGAIYADNPSQAAALTPQRLDAVQALARHAALAIRNAQLFERGRSTIAELRLARDQAIAASRAKTVFLSTMSHELHTPLNAILGYAELLEERFADRSDPETLGDLARIRQAGRRLLHLIDDVLCLSELESDGASLDLRPVALSPFLSAITEEVAPVADARGNAFEARLAPDLGEIVTDATRLRQVVWKLLSNAVKFTERGRVGLEACRLSEGDRPWLELAVWDTGIGMHPEQTRRVFEPFVQGDGSTTRRYEGGGLGLAVARRTCEALGGWIRVESEPGKGSRFTLRLPSVG